MIRHLPAEMTPDLVALSDWLMDQRFEMKPDGYAAKDGERIARHMWQARVTDVPCTPYETKDVHGFPIIKQSKPAIDLTSWRTYGVLRGILAHLSPLGDVECYPSNRGGHVFVVVGCGGHTHERKLTRIEAVIDAIQWHTNSEER